MTSDGQPGVATDFEARPPSAEQAPTPQLRALVLCDLAIETLGDGTDEARTAELVREHDRLVRELLGRHGGFEADKTDGFLALFERPIHAVAFALDYQRALREFGRRVGLALAGRVGIHVGDVVTWKNNAEDVEQGARRVEVEGLAKPVAARLMHLARPRQILLSSIALALAQRAEAELNAAPGKVRWMGHGPYRFKGVPAPMVVHEVGEPGLALLGAPPSDDKATRDTPWWRRPAAMVVETLAVLAVVLAMFMLSGRPQPAIAFAERDWVVVGDLRNMTGDDSLTEALDVAFRISLEQSRHVNVLSDLKVRDTLRRMQRETGTPLDRDTGAEIALREGARALILPTVAEIGGRVRVSAEVIDPHTQTTVYAESHDGVGIASTLNSVDRVTGALRARLGETLKAIEADSQPLPQVTTASIDALKAYAEALEHLGQARFGEAQEEFSRALGIDPDFALAYIGKARASGGADDIDAAHAQMLEARARAGRLTGRDRTYVDAWTASFGPLDEALQAWRLMATLYPDDFAAHYNVAWLAWGHGRVDEEARRSALRAADPHNALKDAGHSLAGNLSLLLGDVAGALDQFQHIGPDASSLLASRKAVALYAAGRGQAARETLEASAPDTARAFNLYWHLASTALDVADGHWSRAHSELVTATQRAASVDGTIHRTSRLALLMLERLDGGPDVVQTRELCAEMRTALHVDLRRGGVHHAVGAGLCAYLLAATDAEAALELLVLIQRTAAPGYPALQAVQAAASAELSRLAGDPAMAVETLEPFSVKPAVLLVNIAMLDALRAAGRVDEALVQAEALAASLPQALAELNYFQALQPFNTAQVRLASLAEAELMAASGRSEEANAAVAELLAAWPDAREHGPAAKRLAALPE
jgi:putative peptide modification system cyclase